MNPAIAAMQAGSSAFAPGMSANPMPEERSTPYGAHSVYEASDIPSYDTRNRRMRIYHPDLAPSTQTTESYLMARSLLQQSYAQDAAATRMARTSNILRDAPRFTHSLNIMA